MKALVVGATGSLGRALAYDEARKGTELFLVASDHRDLNAMKADIEIKFSVCVRTFASDVSNSGWISDSLLSCDRFYFPIGLTLDEDFLALQPDLVKKIFQINFFALVELVNKLEARTIKVPVEIIGFGSIAQTRGRSSNVFYSAAKRSLTSYFESLLHGKERSGYSPYLFQIGYMESQLSFGKKMLFPAAEPEKISKKVMSIVERKKTGIYYLPAFWIIICSILRLVPWRIYSRLKF